MLLMMVACGGIVVPVLLPGSAGSATGLSKFVVNQSLHIHTAHAPNPLHGFDVPVDDFLG